MSERNAWPGHASARDKESRRDRARSSTRQTLSHRSYSMHCRIASPQSPGTEYLQLQIRGLRRDSDCWQSLRLLSANSLHSWATLYTNRLWPKQDDFRFAAIVQYSYFDSLTIHRQGAA